MPRNSMNKKLRQQISQFRQLVSFYLKSEYKPKYSRYYNIYGSPIQNIVETYYLGGNTVQATASAIVEHIKKSKA